MRVFYRIALLLLLSTHALADEKSLVDAAADAARAELAKEDSVKTSAAPAAPNDVILADAATRESYLKSMRGYFDYRFTGYQYRSRVFEWQLLSSRVIFFVVILLVMAGIYFAAVQFHVALNMSRSAASAEQSAASKEQAPADTELEISAKGIVVKSSILGVVVLVLSLAFFYLYLVYVYPINDTV